MSSIINVSTASELLTALQSATGGETILLAPGDYGTLELYDARQPFVKFASEVTIKSADPDNPASFSEMHLSGVENLTFDTVMFDYTAEDGAPEYMRPFMVSGSDNLTIRNSTFDGDLASGLGEAYDGYPTGYGLVISDSSNIHIQDNEIYNFKRGAVFDTIDKLEVSGNDVHDLRSDGLDFAQVTSVVIEGNHIHDFLTAPDSLDHPDMIQFFTNGTTAPSTDILILGNFLDSGDGSATQSIFMRNDMVDRGLAGPEMYYQNITIENNVIYNAHGNGITVGETNGLTITNNTVLQNTAIGTDEAATMPTIHIKDGSTDVVISNNVVPTLYVEPSPEVTLSNNLVVQNTNPSQPNYVGDLFLNALTGADATISDLTAVPGGLIAQLGTGAAMTVFDTTPDTLAGVIAESADSGLHLLHHSFDLTGLYDANGALDLKDATVVWDFGDGTKATGLSSDHVYPDAGTYDVTATVTLSNGETTQLTKAVVVETPIALHDSFDAQVLSASSDMSLMSKTSSSFADATEQQVTYEARDDGMALRLNGGTMVYDQSAEMYNNTQYTVLVDFKKDDGQLDDSGRLVTFGGNFALYVDGNDIAAVVTTDQGSFRMKALDLDLANADWHTLALTFDGAASQAILYLDGNAVAKVDGFDGTIQGVPGSHPTLYLGNPAGGSFEGLIDNFAFVRGVLSADEVAGGAEGLADLVGGTSSDNGTPAPAPIDETPVPPVETQPPVDDSGTPDPVELNQILGTDSNDILVGTDGADEIFGVGGKDRIDAGAGDDVVHLGDQNWGSADGGIGNDSIFGGDAHDTLFGGDGNDLLSGGGGTNKMFGGAGDDLLLGTGDQDRMYGEDGNDIIKASDSGRNILDGGAGNDQLFGGNGGDKLFGGDGDDVLTSGTGRDDFCGGAGADIFVFQEDSGRDCITDFDVTQDVIMLSGLSITSAQQALDNLFEVKGSLYLNLDGTGRDFSWHDTDFVQLAGINTADLSEANFMIAA